MRTIFHILTFVAIALSASGQVAENADAWMYSQGTLEGFAPGTQYFTLVTDANLRAEPGTASKVLAKLPIASRVTVENVSDATFSQKGVTLPWVKVITEKNGTGYIWGGFLALAAIVTPDDEYMPNRGVIYLTGVSAYSEANHTLSIQVRIAKDGKELAKTEFSTQGDLSYYPSVEVAFPPFDGLNSILKVNYYYPACGYPSGNNLLFWQKSGTLARVLETVSVSDAGVFYDSEEMILPNEKGGIGDHILVTKDVSQFEEKGEDMVRTSQSISLRLYKWTGTKLIKAREIKL